MRLLLLLSVYFLAVYGLWGTTCAISAAAELVFGMQVHLHSSEYLGQVCLSRSLGHG